MVRAIVAEKMKVVQERDVELQRKKSLPLEWVLHESRLHWTILTPCEDAVIEAVISMWPEVYISRSSIFEATVSLFDGEETLLPQVESPPKKSIRPQKTNAKKRIIRKQIKQIYGAKKGVQRAKPFAGVWGHASGVCNSVSPQISLLTPRRRRGVKR